MPTVTSADGTEIAYRTTGEGPPLVLVHGTGTTGADWSLLLPFLQDRFTLVVPDRRGRGRSGDAPDYAMEREAEDVLAVLEATGAERLVAHSYGALCSMVALPRAAALRRVVLYEPPISVPHAWARALSDRIFGGEGEEVLAGFLAAVGMTEDQVGAVRSSPAWRVLLGTVPTLARELLSAVAWPRPAGPVSVPVLYLLGAESTNRAYLDGLDNVLALFGDVTVERIPGQQHVAHVFAPEAFADRIAAFCA